MRKGRLVGALCMVDDGGPSSRLATFDPPEGALHGPPLIEGQQQAAPSTEDKDCRSGASTSTSDLIEIPDHPHPAAELHRAGACCGSDRRPAAGALARKDRSQRSDALQRQNIDLLSPAAARAATAIQ